MPGTTSLKIRATGFADACGFLWRADDAVQPALLCQFCQAHDLFGWRGGLTDSLQVVGIQAGQHGYGDDQGPGDVQFFCRFRRGFGSGAHHGWTAAGMYVQNFRAQLDRSADSTGDGIGNIVEFQVEKQRQAGFCDGADPAARHSP